jgi:hypothetical protein
MHTKIRAHLVVDGSSEESLIRCLGVQPGKTWKKGDSVQGTVLNRKTDGFAINSTLPADSSVSDHIKNILDRVHPHRDCIARTGKIESIKLAVVMEIYGSDRPPMQCDTKSIQMLADIGASLDVDIYTFD